MLRSAASNLMWAGRGGLFAVLLAVMVTLVLGYAARAYAVPGGLDPSFGSGGRAITGYGSPFGTSFLIRDIALQEDGKIVVVGWNEVSSNNDLAVARYNADGSLDDGGPDDATPGDSFGSGGKVTTSFDTNSFVSQDYANAVAVQPDGRIVVVGSRMLSPPDSDFAVVRYRPNGSLDTSFGSGGKVVTAFGSSSDQANDLILQPNGKIVAAGGTWTGSDYDFALARYNPDGSLDTNADADPASSFDLDGKAITPNAVGLDTARAIAMQEDGKLVASGYTYIGSGNADFAVARFNPDGSLDGSFDTDGATAIDLGTTNDQATGLAVQEDGKIVAGGYNDQDFALVRLNPGGGPDSSFGSGGKVTTDFGGYDAALDLALQDDGRIVLAGPVGGFSEDFGLARYNPDGSLDSAFDYDGKLRTDIGGRDTAWGLALQPDGKVVAGGFCYSAPCPYNFALARYFGGTDATAPRTSTPAASVLTGSALGASNVAVKLSWSATDADGEVTRYQLQQSTDGGAYGNVPLPSDTARAKIAQLAPAHNYRFRVRATDDNGNTSAFKYGPRFAVDALQETSTAIAYSGTWTRQSLSGAYGGAVKYATTSGATSTFTFTGRNVAWVAPKSSTRGKAEVYLDGRKVATVDLYSSTALSRRVVYAANGLDPSVSHRLQIKVLGTKNASSSGTRVDVDAFVVLR